MSLYKANHEVKEIGGVRCSVVESGIDKSRLDFLIKLLTFNKLEVRFEEIAPKTEGEDVTYNLGVADLLFNPTLAVYRRQLRTPDMHKVTADYWDQKTLKTEPNYWDLSKK